MVDYDAVYKVLFDGIMDAIDDIEKKEYKYARMTLIRAQALAMDMFLRVGDVDNPVLRVLTQSEPEESRADYLMG